MDLEHQGFLPGGCEAVAAPAMPDREYIEIVERNLLLVESAINYNNLPFLIEAKFST
jgi:hypothetical protein